MEDYILKDVLIVFVHIMKISEDQNNTGLGLCD